MTSKMKVWNNQALGVALEVFLGRSLLTTPSHQEEGFVSLFDSCQTCRGSTGGGDFPPNCNANKIIIS